MYTLLHTYEHGVQDAYDIVSDTPILQMFVDNEHEFRDRLAARLGIVLGPNDDLDLMYSINADIVQLDYDFIHNIDQP